MTHFFIMISKTVQKQCQTVAEVSPMTHYFPPAIVEPLTAGYFIKKLT